MSRKHSTTETAYPFWPIGKTEMDELLADFEEKVGQGKKLITDENRGKMMLLFQMQRISWMLEERYGIEIDEELCSLLPD